MDGSNPRDGAAVRTHRFPAGRVGYAVGDIHGRADLLARMFDRLEQEVVYGGEPPVVVFLGDYVDRGPDSAEVLELFRYGRPEGFKRRFLKGNHEAAMLAFLEDPLSNRLWLSHGGLETLASYNVRPLPSIGAGSAPLLAAAASLAEKLPRWHLEFLRDLERLVRIGDYVFVHAGIDVTRPWDGQDEKDLLWIRDRFLDEATVLDVKIVHGHTPTPTPYLDRRRIGIDTGAYLTGALTAVRLEGESTTFIKVTAD